MKNTYWNNQGSYQTTYEGLKILIPDEGSSPIPTIERLRLVANSYYDIYNEGACNTHCFIGVGSILAESDLSKAEKGILFRLFTAALEDDISIIFRSQESDLEDSESGYGNTFHENDFAEALEHLADWAILKASSEYRERTRA